MNYLMSEDEMDDRNEKESSAIKNKRSVGTQFENDHKIHKAIRPRRKICVGTQTDGWRTEKQDNKLKRTLSL